MNEQSTIFKDEQSGIFKKPKFMWKFNIKNSKFSKAKLYVIALYNNHFISTCRRIHMDFLQKEVFEQVDEYEFQYDSIKKVYEYSYNNKDYVRIDTAYHLAKNTYFLIPIDQSQYDYKDFQAKLSMLMKDCITRKNNVIKAQLELEEKESLKRTLELKKQQEFYQNTLNFHIKSDNTPQYIFEKNDNFISMVYLNESNDINFLAIDGYNKKEVNAILQYDCIHYYEKAGNIHYVSDINIDYQSKGSFGGSFQSGSMSIGAAMLGGILFGPMGMAVGAMAGYKPAEYKPPEYTPEKLNVKSTIQKIDERSVILNYYSQQHKQYMDIELPQDIYNFFQTFLPKKKYDVVIELEKSQAKQLQSSIKNTSNQQNSSYVISIKQRLKNLKELYNEELISEEEFLNRKKEILSEV